MKHRKGTYCETCGADKGKTHHKPDEVGSTDPVELSKFEGLWLCQFCKQGAGEMRREQNTKFCKQSEKYAAQIDKVVRQAAKTVVGLVVAGDEYSNFDREAAVEDPFFIGLAMQLIQRRAMEIYLPMATFTPKGVFVCSSCGKKDPEPMLMELGYSRRHEVNEIALAGDTGGDSDQYSDEGEVYTLDCSSCFKPHRLPPNVEVDWV